MDFTIFTHEPFWVLHIHLYLDDGQLQVLSKLLPNILDHYPVSLGTPTLLMKDSLYLILSFSITRWGENPHHAGPAGKASRGAAWWRDTSVILISSPNRLEWLQYCNHASVEQQPAGCSFFPEKIWVGLCNVRGGEWSGLRLKLILTPQGHGHFHQDESRPVAQLVYTLTAICFCRLHSGEKNLPTVQLLIFRM